jgi:hypothetical protein
LETSDILAALEGCRSILFIPEEDFDTVRPYHASLRDFLTNEERSNNFFLAPAKYHAMLMIRCLKAFRNGDTVPEYALVSWNYHANSLLSTVSANQEPEELQSEVERIDLDWVKSWMTGALFWEGVKHLRLDVPSIDLPKTHWAWAMRIKLRWIFKILNDFEKHLLQRRDPDLRDLLVRDHSDPGLRSS